MSDKTVLKLSLGNSLVWALVNPRDNKKYIKASDDPGYTDLPLILCEANPGPVEVAYEDMPGWAKKQINSSIASGQLVNEGDKIGSASAVKKTTKKKASSGKTSKKTSKKSADEEGVDDAAVTESKSA